MMSWTHVPTAGTPPCSSSHQEPRVPQETSQACMGAQSCLSCPLNPGRSQAFPTPAGTPPKI